MYQLGAYPPRRSNLSSQSLTLYFGFLGC